VNRGAQGRKSRGEGRGERCDQGGTGEKEQRGRGEESAVTRGAQGERAEGRGERAL